MAKAAVIGGSGYTGAELLRLLARHPEIEVVHITAATNAGVAIADLYPSLGPLYGDTTFDAFELGNLSDGLDVVFVALPHGESQQHAATLVDKAAHVIDIGADFRLPAETYEAWYGEAHRAPELLGRFAYGLPELFREEIKAFAHVANPGCYPTAAILSLAPLLALGLAEPVGLVVDAVSGISGRGRSLSNENLFGEANESVTAYGLLNHRHTAEMEMALTAIAASPVQVLFTPHVAPMTRGILATCYARASGTDLTSEGLYDAYRDFYADEPFVHVTADPVPTKAAWGANAFFVSPRFDTRTGTILVLGAEDNLVKGASGQAIQNANILLGLPETAGLTDLGVMP